MMHSLTAEKARTLLTRSEELLVSIRINKSNTVSKVLTIAKEGGFLQEICTANLENREQWLDAVRNEHDYPLLLKIGREKRSPIIEAIKQSRDECVEKMLEYGLDINFRPRRTQSIPLQTAIRSCRPELIRTLVEKYHADTNIKSPLWQTPIYAALESRNTDALIFLLKHRADPNNIDSFGDTPLLFFLSDKQLRVLDREPLDILLQHGADCNKHQGQSKMAPLHVVLSNKFAPANVKVMAVEMLLERRADPDLADSENRVPLHYICSNICDIVQKSRCDIVKLLLKYGASPNLQDECYNTPLHSAAQGDLAKVVEVLAENGANPKLRNVDGLRPNDLAGGSKGVQMVLSEAMEKWQDTETENKGKKEETESGKPEGKSVTFKEVAVHLQTASDRFRTAINRLDDAIAQLELGDKLQKSDLETIDESCDEVDGPMAGTDKESILTTKESVEHIKFEFFKLKSYAYSFQNDYKKVVEDLKMHRNCHANFEIPSCPLQDEVDGRPVSYFDQSSQLPKPSEDEKILVKSCHVTSTLLGHDWKTLIRELECDDLIETEVIIKELEGKYPGQLREQAYQALLHWKSKSGRHVVYSNLIDALNACSLFAILDRLEQVFST